MASTGRKRTPAQRKEDLVFISDLYVKGMSSRKISKSLASRRNYSISSIQIQKDIKTLLSDWRKHSLQNIEDKTFLELEKINKVEFHAWQKFDEDGSAKFLEIILKCIDKRCRIFGIDQPVETVLQRQIVVVNLPAIEEPFQEFKIVPNGDE